MFVVSDLGTSTPSFIVNAAGNSGVGTSTPGSKFAVQSGTSATNFTSATTTKSGTGGYNIADGCFSILGVCVGGGGAASSATIYPTIASTSLPTGSYPLSTTTPILAGEQVTIWMGCTKPNAGGSTLWHLNANNGQGTSTIGYSQMQQSGGVNPNMSVVMFGTFTPTTTAPVRLSWASSDDTSISDSSLCQTAFQFTIQRVHPTP